jgi:hypothetical protein
MKDCADTMRWAGTGQANSGVRAEFKLPVDRTLE